MQSWPSVSFNSQAQCWSTPLSCDKCGGYFHEIHLTSPLKEDAAQILAQAAHDHHQEDGCLKCQARLRRSHIPQETHHCVLWWDAEMNDWLVWLACQGIPDGVTLPLGVRFSTSLAEAEVAARCLIGSNPLLLRIVEDHMPYDSEIPSLHKDSGDYYKLWLPCQECQGVDIPLRSSIHGSIEKAAVEALDCFGWVAVDGCPQCRSDEFNHEDKESHQSRVWYDTEIHDWVVRGPTADGEVAEATLGIHAYSASHQEVQEATERLPYSL